MCTEHTQSPIDKIRQLLPEVGLDLHFSPELVLHTGLLKLILEENLEGQDELALTLPGQVDVAKFTLPQGAANVEVFQTPFLSAGAENAKLKTKRWRKRFADLCEMRQTYFDAEGNSRSLLVSLSKKRKGNILGFDHYIHKVVNFDNAQDVLCGVSCTADSDVC